MDSLPIGTATSTTASPTTSFSTAPAPPSSELAHLTESLKLENQFIRVPFEQYKKTIRADNRIFEKEMSAVISSVSESSDSDVSRDEAVHHLSSLASRLQGLKRKLEEGTRIGNLQAQICHARVDHLELADAENFLDWNNARSKWILIDYMLRMSFIFFISNMLRMSYHDTAVIETSNSSTPVTSTLLDGSTTRKEDSGISQSTTPAAEHSLL